MNNQPPSSSPRHITEVQAILDSNSQQHDAPDIVQGVGVRDHELKYILTVESEARQLELEAKYANQKVGGLPVQVDRDVLQAASGSAYMISEEELNSFCPRSTFADFWRRLFRVWWSYLHLS